VIATVMSNLGLERRLRDLGIEMVRAQVGDRYVLEEMRKRGSNVGGEQSGHLILADYSTTGDGLVAALQVLAALIDSGKPASEVLRQFEPLPQLLEECALQRRRAAQRQGREATYRRRRDGTRGPGPPAVRKSGTEPLIRVMAEGEDPELVERIVDGICEAVQASA
jgi:phosphoglucosamine mutase